tara:strand:+ start:359 stop:610 length:252 start_codon:yes stop_codon:yes gene_type:complete
LKNREKNMVFDWLAGGPPIQQRQKKKSEEFEYYLLQLQHSFGSGLQDLTEVNKLGAMGWELVSVTTVIMESNPHDSYYFKRLK